MNSETAAPKSLAGTEAIHRLGADLTSFLKTWIDKTLSSHLCDEIELLGKVIDRSPRSLTQSRYKYVWTAAVYKYFEGLAANPTRIGITAPHRWILYPTKQPYAGEFITDFSINEEHYGFRVACESQWHAGAQNCKKISDALAKLLHVKADLKVLIFESHHSEENIESRTLFETLQNNYFNGYMRFNSPEDFLLLQWSGDKVKGYLWQPFLNSELVSINIAI